MTVSQIYERGWQAPRVRGSEAKIVYVAAQSFFRYWELQYMLEARLLNLRTANRRMRRRCGMPFVSKRRTV